MTNQEYWFKLSLADPLVLYQLATQLQGGHQFRPNSVKNVNGYNARNRTRGLMVSRHPDHSEKEAVHLIKIICIIMVTVCYLQKYINVESFIISTIHL